MTDYFETLSCTATAVPKLVKLAQITKSITAVASPIVIRSLTRVLTLSVTNVITAIGNAIRPRVNPVGVLDSKWEGIATFQLFPSQMETGYSGKMDLGELA